MGTTGQTASWWQILQALEKEPTRWRLSPALRMLVAGAAASEAMFREFDKFGLRVVPRWGMTETSPIGSVNFLKSELNGLPPEEQYAFRAKQGVPVAFFEVRAMGAEGEVAWDGPGPSFSRRIPS